MSDTDTDDTDEILSAKGCLKKSPYGGKFPIGKDVKFPYLKYLFTRELFRRGS